MRRLSLQVRFFPAPSELSRKRRLFHSSRAGVACSTTNAGIRHIQRVANMAVNFPSIDPAALHPVAGVSLGWAEANIRKPNRKDLLVISSSKRARRSRGVFTQNRFCAAPVTVCRENLERRARGRQGHSRAGREHGQRECGHRRAGHGAYARNLRGTRAARWTSTPRAGPAVLDRRDSRAAAGRSSEGGFARRAGEPEGRELVRRRADHHDHRHAAESHIAPGADRRPHGHAVGHQQGRRA